MKKMLNRVEAKLKRNKKKVVLVTVMLLTLFVVTFCYVNITKPTKINKYISHVINKGTPVNTYFDDENFYDCVVDKYNSENSTSLPYTTALSDEQLKSITELDCSSKKIVSAKGVEKLTGLTDLRLYNNKLSTIDVSKN